MSRLGATFLLAAVLPLLAGGGAPVRVIREPIAISEPGRYVVGRSISTDGVVVEIDSSDVELDLNGHTLESTVPSGPAISAVGAVIENVVVHGGTVRAPGACVALDRIDRLEIRELTTGGCSVGIFLDDNSAVVLRNNRVAGTDGGILIDTCKNCSITENSATGALGAGISVAEGWAVEIARNRISESTFGVTVGGVGYTVRDNVISNTATGIMIGGRFGLVESNLVTFSGTGIRFTETSEGNVFGGNVARGSSIDFVDEGSENTSRGDNHLPDRG